MKISIYLDSNDINDVYSLWVLANSTAKQRLSKKQFLELLKKMVREVEND
jgi:hypothetical protein